LFYQTDSVWQEFTRGDESLEPFQMRSGDRWHVASDDRGKLSTFNCATYAIGEAIGLASDDWLEPFVDSAAEGTSPAGIVLEHFYDRVGRWRLVDVDWGKLGSLPSLQADDVLVLVQRSDGDSEIIHMGSSSREESTFELSARWDTVRL
jgi:hypothetical protein